VFLGPDGTVVYEYIKHNLVPLLEDTFTDRGTFFGMTGSMSTTPHFGTIASAICFDMTHIGFVSKYTAVDVMLNPSHGWIGLDPIHAHVARYRAIEHGFSLVHHEIAAFSLSSDSYGRIISTIDDYNPPILVKHHNNSQQPTGSLENISVEEGARVMVSYVPAKGITTLYSLLGDWVAYSSFVLLFIILVRAFFFGGGSSLPSSTSSVSSSSSSKTTPPSSLSSSKQPSGSNSASKHKVQ